MNSHLPTFWCEAAATHLPTHPPTSVRDRLGLLWWFELLVDVRGCFPHWVPVVTILFSLRLPSKALPV